ncbi:hypothetical protein ENSA5_49490 [Enhygromyxa salina]|uniref:Uncharacterized protein n=1 Tax=Enhygromyxa salina TaxID=215803 RepID=A0A2S9XHM5_9BACT|nr:hypothetical protein ENSA5_49490 [Enhygromyxa salina]
MRGVYDRLNNGQSGEFGNLFVCGESDGCEA